MPNYLETRHIVRLVSSFDHSEELGEYLGVSQHHVRDHRERSSFQAIDLSPLTRPESNTHGQEDSVALGNADVD